jgi:hypothetical protein
MTAQRTPIIKLDARDKRTCRRQTAGFSEDGRLQGTTK